MVVMTTAKDWVYTITCRVILKGLPVTSLPVNSLIVGVGKCSIMTLPDSSPHSRYDELAGLYRETTIGYCSHGLVGMLTHLRVIIIIQA